MCKNSKILELSISNQKNKMSKVQQIRSLPVEFVFLTLPYRKVEGTVYSKESAQLH